MFEGQRGEMGRVSGPGYEEGYGTAQAKIPGGSWFLWRELQLVVSRRVMGTKG